MPPQHANIHSIHKELESHNAFFDDLVDMIPAKIYVSGNYSNGTSSSSQQDLFNPKFQKGQNQDTKQARWARSKLAKAANAKHLDPIHALSTREEKMRLEQEREMREDDDSDEDVNFQMDEDDDDNNNKNNNDNDKKEDEQVQRKKKVSKKGKGEAQNGKKREKGKNNKDKPVQRINETQSRIEQLQSKLRAKLEERSRHKPANGQGTPDALLSKRAARRAEKKKRQELAKKKAASASGGGTQTAGLGRNGLPQKVKLVPSKTMGGTKLNNPDTDRKKSQTVMDDLMGIDFGSIAGLKDGELQNNYSAVNKSLKNMGKKKSLERLLAEAEAKKERLRQLKESDNVEDKTKAKNIIWGDTLRAANGEKIKDSDTTQLKKAIKRKVRKKAKSQEAWKSRMEQTKEKMDERQKIRNHNVKQRAIGGAAGANLSKKRIKDDAADGDKDGVGGEKEKKRPRLGPHSSKARAGFEGKKQDFINKGSGSAMKKKKIKSQ